MKDAVASAVELRQRTEVVLTWPVDTNVTIM
jgi:hypothetical protein